MKDTVLFDVNETTLDLSHLGHVFRTAFGSEAVLPLWFARLLHTAAVCAMTGVKTGFRELASRGLDRAAEANGTSLSDAHRDELLGALAHLPAHPDVVPALTRLRRNGRKTVAFSNSSRALLEAQIAHAGLEGFFDEVVSVEEAESFKPDPLVYRFACGRIGRPPGDVWMVAAHDWDVHGAMAAGLRGAFVRRRHGAFHPAFTPPVISAETMVEVVDGILTRDGLVPA
ncbi:MAG: haloacid dehalogenase type II [Myxococcota bacterium]